MKIPPEILNKLQQSQSDARSILDAAWDEVTPFDFDNTSIKFSASSPLPLMSIEEQAQSLAFIIRYEHLPELDHFVAGRDPTNGRFYLNEIGQIRAGLNEYRTIFYNQKDGISYGVITNLYQKGLCQRDSSIAPMAIQVLNAKNEDVSADFLLHLKSRKKAIVKAVKNSDFDFIYNGVLQHSVSLHAMRMVRAYTDGSLAYLLLKNFIIAQGMKDMLSAHYRIIKMLNFPRMGPL